MVLVARPASGETLDRFSQMLAERAGRPVPVMVADVRERQQMLDALDLLAALLPE